MPGERNLATVIWRILAMLPWLVLGVIVFATLSPIGMRPHLGALVHVERFGAFALLGVLFALAYPRRVGLVLLLVVAAAVSLELLQTAASGRHARLSDLAVKVTGATAGVASAWLFLRARWLAWRHDRKAGSAR